MIWRINVCIIIFRRSFCQKFSASCASSRTIINFISAPTISALHWDTQTYPVSSTWHCRQDGITSSHVDCNGVPRIMKFISEGNVYRLICSSHKPDAEMFEKWVFDELLPTIRATGGYVNDPVVFVNKWLPNTDEKTKELLVTSLEAVKRQDKIIGVQKESVDFHHAVTAATNCIEIGEFAKYLSNNKIASAAIDSSHGSANRSISTATICRIRSTPIRISSVCLKPSRACTISGTVLAHRTRPLSRPKDRSISQRKLPSSISDLIFAAK